MRQSRSSGSVEGVVSNDHSYSNSGFKLFLIQFYVQAVGNRNQACQSTSERKGSYLGKVRCEPAGLMALQI